ncbi:tellurite resistance TerB family protein [Rhodobacter sp. NTK016B]|uniref:tellurite resistance TerB family protein n=1 Tax=Rhodobacter sp. NTK016B TaxID=2759676 RepID=UPI001A8DC099|nr:tellurite resistance TerB family protein [Rhodobacter sp. NTK016B]MBN8292364.1 tellurite resistance TerB family protein [Rhodobacter sp. NTK016B]
MTDIPSSLSPQDCLVAVMLMASVADSAIRTEELLAIEQIVAHLPVFSGYDADRIKIVSQTVFDLMEEEDGLDALFGLIRENLPPRLFETAYALSCDVAASDGQLRQTELRMLEEMRFELDLDRLHAAAIERGARARFAQP